ncbi:MAG: hemerythrin domain-containing protein [Candidatus Omnitrophica bacterium]|nr:hemerythrin domain-containing protein [Candidatus Omnitrophota bacterium]MCA9424098.1 hemerythrin domain-containing protein [Candidatus Omnitrophota bacterium]MCA9430878.1 hemerythrin domain-containing protein [Candidatus Omnitrophota bacterium]MCA9439190.1 hemerythrin domain-containing protein [Candidatus Omnitrophota bacterium]
MKPTEILMKEHRIIEQVLNCLEKIGEEAKQNERIEREPTEDALDFFKRFADQCHHGKEEDRLFPLAHERGIPQEGGPIGQMLLEHTIGREAIRKMENAIPAASEGDPPGLASFLEGAQEYVQLLRAHIQKEDQVLFPMADRVLSREDQEKLLASFQEAETTLHDPGTHQACIGIANRLADRYDVEKVVG